MAAASANFRCYDGESEEWELYREQLEQFFVSNKIADDMKKAVLINHLSARTYKLLRDLCTPDQPKEKSYKDLCTVLSTHFTPPVVVHKERRTFFRAQRGEGAPESINDWIVRIKNLAANCKFGGALQHNLVNKFIDGLGGKAFEWLKPKAKVSQWQNNNNGKRSGGFRGCFACCREGHQRKDCPFKNYVCNKCSEKGHLQAACNFQKNHYVAESSGPERGNVSENDEQIAVQQQYITVVAEEGPPLLGKNFMKAFGIRLAIINNVGNSTVLEELLSKYRELFNGELGRYRHCTVSLETEESAIPVFKKPRQVPFKFHSQMNTELEKMERASVITKCDSSPWGTPLVPVLKSDGGLRLCGDYKVSVNRFVKDVKHPLPTVDETFARLNGGQKFSKLDLSKAYNQFELADASKELCAISTIKGVYKMNRLPFGVKPASGIVQREIEKLFCGIPGVQNLLDDVIVTGSSDEEHMARLEQVFEVLEKAGLKLNKDKCQFFKDEVTFIGYVINRFGLKKTDERIRSIRDAPAPKNVTEVRAFAGLVNYYAKFVKGLADLMSPIYKLLKKGTVFI
ncbi:uncharacterized protein K02A2.6-like [Topomyia yanbarensis]|uniref:uncharacterized protein K02A2.6-like n=1 Tax=Topomyia yanbarensis TaxID=2498891 RepID=UPI00273CEE00|nr:uncharacterized protein K02A2.6-like [Topomyia yanbarensis]